MGIARKLQVSKNAKQKTFRAMNLVQKQTVFVFLFQNFFHVAGFVFDSSEEILYRKKE